jgi:hypothetical protein
MIIPQDVLDQMDTRRITEITSTFIHHSDADPTIDIEDIAKMEEASQGFLAIGYNAYVKKISPAEWVVQIGRPLEYIPAAQYGMNTEGYAICIGGRYQPGASAVTDDVDPLALHVAMLHIRMVMKKVPTMRYLLGHRDVATIMAARGDDPGNYSTACPGDLLYAKLDDLRIETGLLKYPGL